MILVWVKSARLSTLHGKLHHIKPKLEKEEVIMFGKKPVQNDEVLLPTRRTHSMLDKAKELKQTSLGGGMAPSKSETMNFETRVVHSWETVMAKRLFDIPYYTGWTSLSCIAVYFSPRMIPDGEAIDIIFRSGLPWRLHVEAFVKGSYPILRTNLGIPYPDPNIEFLYSEAPLDLTDGDVQEFCTKGLERDEIDLIVGHEDTKDGVWMFNTKVLGLRDLLRQELTILMKKPEAFTDKQDFKSSVRVLESTYASSRDGIAKSRCLKLTLNGKAKTPVLHL